MSAGVLAGPEETGLCQRAAAGQEARDGQANGSDGGQGRSGWWCQAPNCRRSKGSCRRCAHDRSETDRRLRRQGSGQARHRQCDDESCVRVAVCATGRKRGPTRPEGAEGNRDRLFVSGEQLSSTDHESGSAGSIEKRIPALAKASGSLSIAFCASSRVAKTAASVRSASERKPRWLRAEIQPIRPASFALIKKLMVKREHDSRAVRPEHPCVIRVFPETDEFRKSVANKDC
jgi:hypothetical protein